VCTTVSTTDVTAEAVDGAVYKGIGKSHQSTIIVENGELLAIGNARSTSTAYIEE